MGDELNLSAQRNFPSQIICGPFYLNSITRVFLTWTTSWMFSAVLVLGFSLGAAAWADWRRIVNCELGAAYWAHAFLSWLLIPAALYLGQTQMITGEEEALPVAQLLALGLAAHARWRTSSFCTLFFFLQATVGGPPMVLCKLLLEVGDPTESSFGKRASLSTCAQNGLYFGASILLPALVAEYYCFSWNVAAWGFTAKTLCWSLLLLSVLELNLFFNLRFLWWLAKQRQPWRIALSTAAHATSHIAIGSMSAIISLYSLPTAWAVHLTWLSVE